MGKSYMSSILGRIYRYSDDCRSEIRLGILYSFLNKLFDVAPELLIGVAVDLVVRQENSLIAHLGIKEPIQQLLFLGSVTFVVWLFESLFQYLYSIKWKNVAQKLQHALRLDTYAHIQKLDMEWLQKNPVGSLQTILNDDVNQLERFIDNGFNDIVQIVSSTVLIGFIFLYLSPIIALGTVLPIPFILLGVVFFQKKIQPRYSKVREQAGILGSRIETNLTGISVIKSYTAEDFQYQNLLKDSLNYRKANEHAIRVSSAFIPLIRIVILAGFLITLILGGWMTMQGTLPVGSYSALVFLTQRFLWPFTFLGQLIDNFSRAKASAIRIFHLLDTSVNVEFEKDLNLNALPTVKGEIALQNIHFAYEDKYPVFSDFSLNIPRNKMVALVGHTGSGKSTLIKLLLRFYKPQQGKILFDGQTMDEFPVAYLRKNIAYVSQDIIMFPGDIEQNIAFADPNPDHKRVVAAAKVARADDFIEKLPNKYQTAIGEKGYKLSGGQRQRISIARAIYKDSPILIFDEATSNIDNKTEVLIKQALAEISKNKTTIVIAHRLSTIVHADLIYVLEDGKVIGQGSHQELLEHSTYYSHLWGLQTGEGI